MFVRRAHPPCRVNHVCRESKAYIILAVRFMHTGGYYTIVSGKPPLRQPLKTATVVRLERHWNTTRG